MDTSNPDLLLRYIHAVKAIASTLMFYGSTATCVAKPIGNAMKLVFQKDLERNVGLRVEITSIRDDKQLPAAQRFCYYLQILNQSLTPTPDHEVEARRHLAYFKE